MAERAVQKSLLPLEREKTSDRVVKVIENYIIRNRLKRGERLPSERELSETLNVGTRSIREALRNLEARGVVRIEHGRGTFVEEKYRDDFARFLADSLELTLTRDQNLLIELVSVRKIVETSAIADVALTRSEEIVERLKQVLGALEAAKDARDQEAYNRLDVTFHKTIIDATGNRVLTAIYDRMTDLLLESFAKTGYVRGGAERSFSEHREMVESIALRDPTRAERAMASHLEKTVNTLRSFLAAAQEAPTFAERGGRSS